MTPEGMLTLVVFLMVSSGVLLVSTLVSGRGVPARHAARRPDGSGRFAPPAGHRGAVRPHDAAPDGYRGMVPTDEGGADPSEVSPDPRRILRPASHADLPRREDAPDGRSHGGRVCRRAPRPPAGAAMAWSAAAAWGSSG